MDISPPLITDVYKRLACRVDHRWKIKGDVIKCKRCGLVYDEEEWTPSD